MPGLPHYLKTALLPAAIGGTTHWPWVAVAVAVFLALGPAWLRGWIGLYRELRYPPPGPQDQGSTKTLNTR